MARWILGCCLLVVPLDLLVVFLITFVLPHSSAAILLGFWVYFFPVFCALLLVGTAAFQTTFVHVPRMIAFGMLAFVATAINVPVHLAFTFFDRLGPM